MRSVGPGNPPVFNMSSPLAWWLQVLWLHPMALSLVAGSQIVYFDRYGHCSRGDPFDLSDDTYMLHEKGGGLQHESMHCRLYFKATPDTGVCLAFQEFSIQQCGVTLQIKTSDSNPQPEEDWRTLSCNDQRPTQMCTSNRYVSVAVNKKRLNGNTGYNFRILVKSNTSASGEESVLFASIGVFVGVILGVVVILAISAIIVVYCCCKKRKRSLDVDTDNTAHFVHPTAPPFGDVEEQAMLEHPVPPQLLGSGQCEQEQVFPQHPPPPYTLYDGEKEGCSENDLQTMS